MITRSSQFALLLTIGLLPATTAQADDIADKLKERMATAEKDGFSGAVIVTKDGKPLLCEGYRFANIELEVRNTPQTKFRLGSITKQFTAMAVMILLEREKLNVDDEIGKYLDDSPEAWKDVTIRHLLNHTSGVRSYTSFPQMMTRTVRQSASVDEIIATFKDKTLEFQPGEQFAYSNSGYILLGKIIERASGQNYESFLREAIFEPLAMNDSGYDHNDTIIPRRAAGYNKPLLAIRNAPYIDMTWPYAAGALYSTVGDLARWDQALTDGKLLSSKSYEMMFAPAKNKYAFGWFVDTKSGHKVIYHGGGIHGFSTSIVRYPDDKLCVVVLSNIIPSPAEWIAQDLATIALDSRPQP